jgi:hypothetical protein
VAMPAARVVSSLPAVTGLPRAEGARG